MLHDAKVEINSRVCYTSKPRCMNGDAHHRPFPLRPSSSFRLSDTANTGYTLGDKLVPKGTAGAVRITEGAAALKGKVALSGIYLLGSVLV